MAPTPNPSLAERIRKPRPKPAPYVRKEKATTEKNPGKHRTTAKPVADKRENLTLGDWLQVLDFVSKHPDMSQQDVVKHFATKKDGALIFTQSTLSRKLRDRSVLEGRAGQTSNALDMKRPRVVTEPNVERGLVEWVRQMNARGEVVTGPMLVEKRARFEQLFKVPEERRMIANGWVSSFCKAYGLREIRRHGEAASADLKAVEEERERIAKELAPYAPKDRFNFDETSFFPHSPPDRGLASRMLSGKKIDKFRITFGVGSNADGSEKLPVIVIGKSKNPRCFKNMSAATRKQLYYRNNKTAWMVCELFAEYLRKLDLKMIKEKRKIVLLVDNFSAHYCETEYIPKNIKLVFFEPNLTAHVQPMDGGPIRTWKALYRKALCRRALDLDEAGETEIFKINLLESIVLGLRAWDAVTPETLKNCWNHVKIQPTEGPTDTNNANSLDVSPSSDALAGAWAIIWEFATSESMTLPQAEERLQSHLGSAFKRSDWDEPLKAIMDAEGDAAKAIEAINRLAPATGAPTNPMTAAQPHARSIQTVQAENDLMANVAELQRRNCIKDKTITVDDIVDPPVERQDPETINVELDGSALEKAIVDKIEHENRVASGEVMEIDSDDEDGEGAGGSEKATRREVIDLCARMEKLTVEWGGDQEALRLAERLRAFRGRLVREGTQAAQQSTLETFFK